MNEFSLKNKIFERAFALGFSACGITPVKEVDADCRLHFDKWLQKGKEARMQYMRNYKDKRFDPRLLVENARSVLVVALNYYPSIHIPENHPQFALYSYGQDYHIVLKEKLNELFSYINTLTPIEGRIFCDTAPIMERYWAQQAGIGFIGKNTQLIIPGKGSFLFRRNNFFSRTTMGYSHAKQMRTLQFVHRTLSHTGFDSGRFYDT